MTSRDPSATDSLPALDARLTAVIRYWDDLRDGRPVPARVEVRPTDLTPHLSRICILERPRAGTMRMRLAGATLCSRMGMELRGMPFRALFEMEDRGLAMTAAEMAIATPAVSILALSRQERGGAVAEAVMAILPLSDTRGGLTRALAHYSERPAVTPFVTGIRGRFAISGVWSLDIPETGRLALPAASRTGADPDGRPGVRLVSRGGRAQSALALTASRLDCPGQSDPAGAESRPDPVARPRFRVIDGGRA